MRVTNISPRILKNFSGIVTRFAVGEFDFNLSTRERVIAERQDLLKNLEIKAHQLVSLSQQHQTVVLHSRGVKVNFLKPEITAGDGLFTQDARLYLSVRTADCLPVLFYHSSQSIVGIIHAGWKGTEGGILPKAIKYISQTCQAPLKDFYFFFGPAAHACCYEGPHRHFVEDNFNQLMAIGIMDFQIEQSRICTIHHTDYPSHRREQRNRKTVLLSVIGQQ